MYFIIVIHNCNTFVSVTTLCIVKVYVYINFKGKCYIDF